MFKRQTTLQTLIKLIMLALILAGCQPTSTPEPAVATMVVTEVVEATPVETVQVIQVMTPTPEPTGPRTLVICLGAEPAELRVIGWGYVMSGAPIKQALFEGGGMRPIDFKSYSYQPIIFEKKPSLADGDAALTVVAVDEGDLVVDVDNNVITLDPNADPPQMLAPAGGGDPVPYRGGEFQMVQLSSTFKMLPNLMWSDGYPLTASDSVYGFNLWADPDFGMPSIYTDRTTSYEAIDESTIVWTGLPGHLEHVYDVSFWQPAPEHLWGKYSTAELLESEEFTRKPIGWGPYIIDEWIEGESVNMRKNPRYFRADEGLPKFDNLIFRFIGENTTEGIAAVLAGECDILDSSNLEYHIELLRDLQADGQIKVSFTTSASWELINFGIQPREYDDGYQLGVDRPDFFSDVRTRRAFAHCMDRQALVDTILFGQSFVLDSTLPPQHPLYNPDVPHYEFDVQAGRALLEEVGWVDDDGNPETPRIAQGVTNVVDGTPLEVAYETTSSPIRQQITTVIKNSLAQCGIQARVQLYAPDEFFADGPEGSLWGRKFDLGQFAWATGGEPDCNIWESIENPGPVGETWISIMDGDERPFKSSGWGGSNIAGFADQEFDQACSTAMGSLPGQLEYEAAHHEAQRIFAEQLPAVPLFPIIMLSVTRPDMCGYIMDPSGGSFWNIEEFDYGEGCEE